MRRRAKFSTWLWDTVRGSTSSLLTASTSSNGSRSREPCSQVSGSSENSACLHSRQRLRVTARPFRGNGAARRHNDTRPRPARGRLRSAAQHEGGGAAHRGRDPSRSATSTTTRSTARRAARRAIFAPTVAPRSNGGSSTSAAADATRPSCASLWQRTHVISISLARGSAGSCGTSRGPRPLEPPAAAASPSSCNSSW